MDSRRLRAFLVLAEELHFGRAARRLHLSQPALSQMMRRFEDELGAPLLTRDSHGVALTTLGAFVAREGRTAWAHLEFIRQEVERVRRGGAPRLRVGYTPGPSGRLVPDALRQLAKHDPDVVAEPRELETPALFAALRSAEIDAAVSHQTDGVVTAGLDSVEIARHRLMAAMSRDDALARRRTAALAELRGRRFVLYEEAVAPGLARWITALCREAGFNPRVEARVRTADELLAHITGRGLVTFLMGGYRWRLPSEVAMRPLTPAPETVPVCLWWRRGDASRGLHAFRKALSGKPARSRRGA